MPDRGDRARQTEFAVADDLRAEGVLHAEAGPRSTRGSDVLGWPGVNVEVKATETASPGVWLEQVNRRARPGELPLVLYRPRGSGPSNIDQWPATVPWGVMKDLLRSAGHLPPLPAVRPEGAGPVPVDLPASSETPPNIPPP
jgi:hypothetical protein